MAHHRGRDTNFRCNPEFGADSLMISFRSLTGLISMMEIIVKISAIQQLTFSRFRDLLTVGCPTCGVLGLPNIERNQKHLRKALVFPDIGVTNGSPRWTTYGTFLIVVLVRRPKRIMKRLISNIISCFLLIGLVSIGYNKPDKETIPGDQAKRSQEQSGPSNPCQWKDRIVQAIDRINHEY